VKNLINFSDMMCGFEIRTRNPAVPSSHPPRPCCL